jgi:5-formyltetrahydrofolate cyclo-ligase
MDETKGGPRPVPPGEGARPSGLDIHQTKKWLRRELRARIRALPEVERRRQSAEIVRRIEENRVWRGAQWVLFYAPLPEEADIWPLLERGLASKKRVALPRRLAEDDGHELVEVRDVNRDCHPGQFGVREPLGSPHAVPLGQFDLILVPGLGFDRAGGRLGRGKGHYDRLLSGAGAICCGVAFAEQMIAEAPLESHDVRMNCVVTPEGWLEAPAAPPALE